MEKNAQTTDLKHPILDVLEMIKSTPVDMIEFDLKQKEDGSKDFHVHIPGRAEQAKRKAMQDALKGRAGAESPMEAAGVKPVVEPIPEETPEIEEMPAEGGIPQMAKSNVQIKVAMKPVDVKAELKTKYPDSFLKAMGL